MDKNNALPNEVTIPAVTMSKAEALAYAQFLKRVCFSDYRGCAVDNDEAYRMVYAGEKIRAAFAETGFAPR